VAVTNDCIYGHDVGRTTREHGGTTTTVRLSLVRGSRYPDPAADQGRHTSRITVRPGATIADAVEEGYRTNLPLRRIRGERDVRPLVSISNPAIVVEAVKLAEDRSGDVVVRLYEALGGHAVGELSANFEVSAATFTDLLERPARDAATSASTSVRLDLRPFEIVTVRLAQGETES
jgi:alpha-mannosidase